MGCTGSCTGKDDYRDSSKSPARSASPRTPPSSPAGTLPEPDEDMAPVDVSRNTKLPGGWRYARCSVKGSRDTNEDHHGAVVLDHYIALVLCDGHGPALSEVLGSMMQARLRRLLPELSPDAAPEQLVGSIRQAYQDALQRVDSRKFSKAQTGSTISCAVVQLQTMRCCALQLGDCRICVCDARTGLPLEAQVVYYVDDADPGAELPPDRKVCVTAEHWFGCERELRRINQRLEKSCPNLKLVISRRSDAMRGEDRRQAGLVDRGTNRERFKFNEPSRGVENLRFYGSAGFGPLLCSLQREPEVVVWQLPTASAERPLLLAAFCDGFASHNCFPSVEHALLCMVDPEGYMAGRQCLNGTCFETLLEGLPPSTLARLPKLSDDDWKDACRCCYRMMAELTPDRTWRSAVENSWKAIVNLRAASKCGEVQPLVQDPQAAATMAANLAVLLMSDDNVTLEALLISAPAGLAPDPSTQEEELLRASTLEARFETPDEPWPEREDAPYKPSCN